MSTTKMIIEVTTDYKKFILINGNRIIDKQKVKRLMETMTEYMAMSPIQVNEKMQIIDGQHRFTALCNLGKPIYYYVVKGATIKDVQALNTHTDVWDHKDYVNSYVSTGNNNYAIYKQFKEKYGLGTTTNLFLLTGSGNIKEQQDKFSRGQFVVSNILEAEDIASKIVKMSQYVPFYKDRSFCYAMMRAIKNPSFLFDIFFNEKMTYQSRKLVKCANVVQYLALIQEIYNYRAKKTEKVQLVDL
jgi:hypothetical protein